MKHGGYGENLYEIATTLTSRDMSAEKKKLRLGVRFGGIRERAIKKAIEAARGRARAEPTPTVLDLDVDRAVEELRHDGLSLSIHLSPKFVEQVLYECRQLPFMIDRDPKKPIAGAKVVDDPAAGFEGEIAAIMDPHKQIESLERLTRDERILGVVERYLGAPPVFDSTQIWFTRPNPVVKPSDVHLYGFHYDIADYRFVVITIYLSDVDDKSGPHVFVKTSHRDWSLAKKIKRRISDDEADRRFGSNVTTITGPVGTGFFADNLAYHKGARPYKPRAVLQLIYGLREKPAGGRAMM